MSVNVNDPTEPCCKNCRFMKGDVGTRLDCRRHAPISSEKTNGVYSQGVWPQVYADDWCGDFVLDW